MDYLEKAAVQGQAWAMQLMGSIYNERKEYVLAVKWYTKGAEAGLKDEMFNLAVSFDEGSGMAAPDYPAAADWYRQVLKDDASHILIHVLDPGFLI